MKKNYGTAVLDSQKAYRIALDSLIENIPFQESRDCDNETVFGTLLRAASQKDSIENTSKTLTKLPCGNTIRNSLKQYNSIDDAEKFINHALQNPLPPSIRNAKHELAIDYNLLSYYGKPSPEEEEYICRSKSQNGTSSFYVYATLYIIRKGKRVTIALVCVRKTESYVSVITRLLNHIASLNIKIKCLYADRGFYSVPVIRWLKALDIPFVIPVIVRGKSRGTRQIINEKRTRKTTYTMNSSQYGSITFDIIVVCVYSKGKYGKHGTKVLAYAVHNIKTIPHQIHKTYRKRFGIETSYRMKNICRIKTTTKNSTIRFIFIGISFLIVNLWIYLLWKFVSYPRKGGRLIFREVFPLKQLLNLLCIAVDQRYKSPNIIYL